MGYLSEKDFDRKNENGYSIMEYDLYAKLGLSIRKNHNEGRYEIFKIKTKEVQYTYTNLKDAIRCANELEGDENTFYK